MFHATNPTPLASLLAFSEEGLRWLDLFGALLIGGGILLGFLRGLWWQVVRLLGVAGAIVLARTATPFTWPQLLELFPQMPERLAHGLTWVGLFLAGLVAATLFGLVGKKSLEVMQLGLIDRFGGALAGLLTGSAIQAALVVGLLHFTPRTFSNAALDETYSAMLFDSLGAQVPLLVDERTAENLRPWLMRDVPEPEEGWRREELRAEEGRPPEAPSEDADRPRVR